MLRQTGCVLECTLKGNFRKGKKKSIEPIKNKGVPFKGDFILLTLLVLQNTKGLIINPLFLSSNGKKI